MKKNIKVSLIVPVYNVEKYIEKCLMSLVNQSYKNCEFIFINDGTKDDSYKILKNLKKKLNDNRIILLSQENSGVSSARNKGLEFANGDYVVFVDADDYLSEEYVDYMLSLIDENNADFAYSIENFKKKNELQSDKIFSKEITNNESVALLLGLNVTVGCWNKIYKREFLINNKLRFSTDLYYGEGLAFIIKVSQLAKKIIIGNKKVYFYRKNNENSATTKYNNNKYVNGEKALNLIGDSVDLNDDRIKSSFYIHLATFYLGAIVKIIENNKKEQYKLDYLNWKKGLRSNVLYIIKSKYISLYRKCMIIGGIFFPHVVAYLNIKREKNIFSQSV